MRFSNLETQVVNYLMQNKLEVVSSTISQVALACDTSEATISRVTKKMGFESFYQLKVHLSISAYESGDNGALEEISDLKSYALNCLENIKNVSNNLDEAVVSKVVESIKNSNFTFISAVGDSATVAVHTEYRMNRLGFLASYTSNIERMYATAHNLVPDNLLLALSFSGESKDVIETCKIAKEKKIKIVAVTGKETSPLSKISDLHLYCQVMNSTSVLQNNCSLYMFFLIDMLLNYIAKDFDKEKILTILSRHRSEKFKI